MTCRRPVKVAWEWRWRTETDGSISRFGIQFNPPRLEPSVDNSATRRAIGIFRISMIEFLLIPISCR
jgi:hypothetical protein